MKLQFDRNQEQQLQAIRSAVDLFEGQPLSQGDFEISFTASSGGSNAYGAQTTMDRGVGNALAIPRSQILVNLQNIQQDNGIAAADALDVVCPRCGRSFHDDGRQAVACPDHPEAPTIMNFTVEMETGTGKTYVYLRTIYELYQKYGFRKFVIVVPSIAIREGVLKNLEITREHFQSDFNHPPLHYQVYSSAKLSGLRNFAVSNAIQILVINIDSFAKDQNVINQIRETGVRPIEYIQAVHPVVIMDEPQNMETDRRREAIANLNPCCTLRYSATHRNLYNLLYSLNPVTAYDLGLVKQIGVTSVISRDDNNAAYVGLEGFSLGKKSISAKVSLFVNERNGVVKKTFKLRVGDDLYERSNRREIYRDRFILNAMDAREGYVEFSNGIRVYEGSAQGGLTDEVMKRQIRETVETHLHKERQLKGQGIKVLSLFFIDRVANYRALDENGAAAKGKFALWFEEAFRALTAGHPENGAYPFSVEQVHNGYFAQDKKGAFRDSSGESKEDDDVFQLIMKDKERLLDPDEPLRFIFSHSALREGWDNPNVFQICTLNETRSDMKKRQEIGRGLRLPVNHDGVRIVDKNINVLTVVANESYEDFARQLQNEIEDECGVQFTGRIRDNREKRQVRLRKGYELDQRFLDLWNRIRTKTVYRVEYRPEELIEKTSRAIRELPRVSYPVLEISKADLAISEKGVAPRQYGLEKIALKDIHFEIPDVFGYIQGKVALTKQTILQILLKSGKLDELLINPQAFLDRVVSIIKGVLNALMIDGIKYETINGQTYEMRIFEEAEIETYLSGLVEVAKPDKTLYNYIQTDSGVERQFAKDCDNDDRVEFYFKLPPKFTIPTPIGDYNPDWALVLKRDRKIYFVAETKASLESDDLRRKEDMKLKCGTAHFREFADVEYRPVGTFNDLIDPI